MRFGKSGVSLSLRNPFKASDGSTSVFVLYTGGQLFFNRGYLIDGGMAPEDVLASLDEQIRALFPSGKWGEKGYYVTIPPPPDPDAIRAFGRLLQQQVTSLATRSEQLGVPKTS